MKLPIQTLKVQFDLAKGKFPAGLVAFIVFTSSFISDRFIPNSFLSFPLIISTLISAIVTQWGIPKLALFHINQSIRKEGPKSHQKKSGTPTMGGLLVVPIGVVIGSLISVRGTSSEQLIALGCITLSYMFIGGLDDLRSITLNTNTGLSPEKKLILQGIAASLFLAFANWKNWINSSIAMPFDSSIELGFLIWPLAIFVFLAESNSTNLTDGLDGLASGCSVLVFTGLAIELMLRGNEGNPAIAGYCMAMAGTWIGFLIHNQHPAKVFMGDTGSLAIGAALTGVALLANSLWPLLIMGGVFAAESISVILQVSIFKITKQINGQGYRLLKMAPLHHHFELSGVNEKNIVQSFWIATLICILLSLIIRH